MARTLTALHAAADLAVLAGAGMLAWDRMARSEATIRWWTSTVNEQDDYQPWPASDSVLVAAGQTLYVRVTVENAGRRGGDALFNLIAPGFVGIRRWDLKSRDWLSPQVGAENDRIGVPPGRSVQYFAEERRWPPGLHWVHIFELTLPWELPKVNEFWLGVDLNAPRLGNRQLAAGVLDERIFTVGR